MTERSERMSEEA